MNILKKYFIKVLVGICFIFFTISMIAIFDILQRVYRLSVIQDILFTIFIFVIYYIILSYLINNLNSIKVFIALFIQLVAPIILGIYIIFRKYISLTTYLLLIALFLISILSLFYFFNVFKNLKLNNILIKQKNPELYIKEVDKLIQNTKDKAFKYRLYLKKVSALLIQRNYKKSIYILEEIEVDILGTWLKFNYYIYCLECYLNLGNSVGLNKILNKFKKFQIKSKKLQVYYINALLYYLTIMERIDEAKVIYNQNSSILYSNSIKGIRPAINDTIATYKYYCGYLDESKEMFLRLDNETEDNVKVLVNYNYFLGLIYLKEGKELDAKLRFEKVLELGKGTYFYNKVIEEHHLN
ncbi:hypothetical protein [Natronospora cellulosivora (SeqCode)]